MRIVSNRVMHAKDDDRSQVVGLLSGNTTFGELVDTAWLGGYVGMSASRQKATYELAFKERGRQLRRPSVTSRAAQCPVRGASSQAARLVRPFAI